MRFGPEVNDALGGRLEGRVHLLPNHCAAILRALLFYRAPARLEIGTITGVVEEHKYVLEFRTPEIREFGDLLNTFRQEGFADIRELTKAVSSKTVCACFMRRGSNESIALIQKTQSTALRMRVFKTIASLPTLLPGLFAEKPLSDLEKALLEAAFEAKCDVIEELLEKMYKETDLGSERQRRALHGMLTYQLNSDLRRTKEEARRAEEQASINLRNYMAQTQSAMANKVQAEDIERRIGSMEQDVLVVWEYLQSNKTVSVNVEGNVMVIDVIGPLTNFDPDAYRIFREKPCGHLIGNISGDREDALLFFDALFLEELIKIRVSARYSIEPRYGVHGKSIPVTPAAIPNPHIQYYGCLGQYAGDMQEALSRSDFIGVISLCIASGLSLNVPEPATCGRFIKDVTGKSHMAVLLPGGEAVSYRKAVSWLKQQKGIEEGGDPDGETNPDDGGGD